MRETLLNALFALYVGQPCGDMAGRRLQRRGLVVPFGRSFVVSDAGLQALAEHRRIAAPVRPGRKPNTPIEKAVHALLTERGEPVELRHLIDATGVRPVFLREAVIALGLQPVVSGSVTRWRLPDELVQGDEEDVVQVDLEEEGLWVCGESDCGEAFERTSGELASDDGEEEIRRCPAGSSGFTAPA